MLKPKNELGEILELINSINENMLTKADGEAIRRDISDMSNRVTQVERGQREILDELKPLSRAHDKDARTIISHETRITRLEKHLSA